jgi:cell division protein FtsB
MKETNFGKKVQKVLLNKYAITLFIFAVLFIFIGEQSLINQFSRSLEIRETKQDIQRIQTETLQQERTLRSLDNPDSLERFAREQYNMHAAGEEVYIVE